MRAEREVKAMELPVKNDLSQWAQQRKRAGQNRVALGFAACFLLGVLAGGFGLVGFCPLVFPLVLATGLLPALGSLMGLTFGMVLGFGQGSMWAAALGILLFFVRWASWPIVPLRKSKGFVIGVALLAPLVLLFLFFTPLQRTPQRVWLLVLQGVLGAGLTALALGLKGCLSRPTPLPLVGREKLAFGVLGLLFCAALTAWQLGQVSVGCLVLAAALLCFSRQGLQAGALAGVFCGCGVLLAALPNAFGKLAITPNQLAMALTFFAGGALAGWLFRLPKWLVLLVWLSVFPLMGAFADLSGPELVPGFCTLLCGGLVGVLLPHGRILPALADFFQSDEDKPLVVQSRGGVLEQRGTELALASRVTGMARLLTGFAKQGEQLAHHLPILEDTLHPTGEQLMTCCEPVCRSCKEKLVCWQDQYAQTLDCFAKGAAVWQTGSLSPDSFPDHFQERCNKLHLLCETANLALKQPTRGLCQGRPARAATTEATVLYENYQQLASALWQLTSAPQKQKPTLGVRLGVANQAAGGEPAGDRLRLVTCPEGCALLLADGMGTGKLAAVDAAMLVSQLEKAIALGLNTQTALALCAHNLQVKSDYEGTVAVDVARISLATGRMELHKAGSPPVLLLHGDQCRRIEKASLPLGVLQPEEKEPVMTKLVPGDRLILASDGLWEPEQTDPHWQDRLLDCIRHAPNSPQFLSEALLDLAKEAGSKDDITVAVLELYALEAD